MRSMIWVVLLAGMIPAAALAQTFRYEGLVRVDESLLREQARIFLRDVKAGGAVANAAQSNIIRTLFGTGFFDNITITRTGDDWVAILQERPIVYRVDLEGVESLDEKDEKRSVRIRKGDFFDAHKVVDTKRALREAYAEEGIQDVDIRVATELRNGKVRVRIIVDERDKVLIRSVQVLGNYHFSDDTLVGRLQTRPRNALGFITQRGVYDPAVVDIDVQRIDAAYQEAGFLKVALRPASVTWNRDRHWVDVVYGVVENTRYKLGQVTFEGDLIFSNKLLRDQLDLSEGDWANRLKIEEAVRNYTDLYGDLGFAFARINPQFKFDEENAIVDLHFSITKGEPVFFRTIEVRGNTKTRDKVVRREMLIEEGQMFNGARLRASRDRIFALGFFEDVSMTTRAYGQDQMDVTIRVAEKSTGTVSAGLGFSSVDSFVGTLKLNFGNLLGYGIRLDFNGEIGGRRKSISVSYLDPYFLDTKTSLGIDVFFSDQQFFLNNTSADSYQQLRYGGVLTFGYLVGLYSRVFAGYRNEFVKTSSDTLNATIFGQSGRTSSVQLTFRRDSKNHAYDPTKGSIHMVRAEYAGGAMGGDFVFEKYTGLSQWFFNPFWKFVLMLRGEIGLITSRESKQIPFAERYFLGGINSLRGYVLRSVGPERRYPVNPNNPFGPAQDLVVGGNKQVFANAELIFPILPVAGIKGLVFFDAGNTWAEEQAFFEGPNRNPFEFGAGFGVRWFSPIGPLRFEWGYPLDPEVNQRKSVFEFTIGTFF